jgi:GlpG protein
LTREVGNGAHLGGLLLGAATAEAVVMRRRPRLAKAGLVLLLLFSVTVSVVCPWSPTWWATRGWHAHAGGRYALAIDAYDLSLHLRPDQPWVLASLVRAHRAAGHAEAAAAVLERLRTVSPEDAEQLDEESRAPAP